MSEGVMELREVAGECCLEWHGQRGPFDTCSMEYEGPADGEALAVFERLLILMVADRMRELGVEV